MLTCSNSNQDTRVSHNYRMPIHQKRSPGNTDAYLLNGPFRSPSPIPKRHFSRRRHSTPHLLSGRAAELKIQQANTMLKDYHPEITTIKERTLVFNRPDPQFSRRRSRSLIKRFPCPDDRMVSLSSSFTTAEAIILSSKKNLPRICETSVTSNSDVPLVNYDISSKKPWTQRQQTRSNSKQTADVANSDEETFSESSVKPNENDFSSCCEGKCIEYIFNCTCCQCYYQYPFCCWLSCLILALCFIVVVFRIIGFFPV